MASLLCAKKKYSLGACALERLSTPPVKATYKENTMYKPQRLDGLCPNYRSAQVFKLGFEYLSWLIICQGAKFKMHESKKAKSLHSLCHKKNVDFTT